MSQNYRGFELTVADAPTDRRYRVRIGSDDPDLAVLLGEGGEDFEEAETADDAISKATKKIDTLLAAPLAQTPHFEAGQHWVSPEGEMVEVVETRFGGLEARFKMDAGLTDWQVLNPRDDRWHLAM